MTIEQGVPLSSVRGRKRGPLMDAIAAMSVGDSFVVERAEKVRGEKQRLISVTARRLGVAVTTRTTEDGKVRLWLVAKDRSAVKGRRQLKEQEPNAPTV